MEINIKDAYDAIILGSGVTGLIIGNIGRKKSFVQF